MPWPLDPLLMTYRMHFLTAVYRHFPLSSNRSLVFICIHLFYLHFLSSNNPLRNSTNNKIPFFPFIFLKDFFGFILILCLYLLQTHFGISSFSHPDNALEVCGLLTPLHIVPEWYFLCQYAMLKAVPNKNAGFIILFTSRIQSFVRSCNPKVRSHHESRLNLFNKS